VVDAMIGEVEGGTQVSDMLGAVAALGAIGTVSTAVVLVARLTPPLLLGESFACLGSYTTCECASSGIENCSDKSCEWVRDRGFLITSGVA